MEFQVFWFVLWGLLWAIYFMLDGFDLGIGVLHRFIGKNETEKRIVIKTIGPVWDGNEVWLITAGAATFAAFPVAYALIFSYLYSAFLLILFSLILRGVALEFREKVDSATWRTVWDIGLFLGSLLSSFLFGVAVGNVIQGIPMDAGGYSGTLLSLLNPYGLLTGLLFVALFLLHGSLWITLTTAETLSERAANLASKLWYALFVIALTFLIYTLIGTNLSENYMQNSVLLVVPALAVVSFVAIKLFCSQRRYGRGFYSSCLAIVTATFSGLIGLYPNLIPSSIDPRYGLTIFNSSSSVYTLKIMTVVVAFFVPLVIAYQIWVYSVFRHKIKAVDVSEERGGY